MTDIRVTDNRINEGYAGKYQELSKNFPVYAKEVITKILRDCLPKNSSICKLFKILFDSNSSERHGAINSIKNSLPEKCNFVQKVDRFEVESVVL